MISDSELKQAQGVMLKLLKAIDELCIKHGIEYFLISGTLLGAVRHKGFIPWDDDMDIAMVREDYERFKKIALTELPAGMALQTRKTDPYYRMMHVPCKVRDLGSLFIEPGHENDKGMSGIYVDIFPFDKHSTDEAELQSDIRFWKRFVFMQRYTKKRAKNFFHGLLIKPFDIVARIGIKIYLKIAYKRIERNAPRLKEDYCLMPGYDLYWFKTNVFKKDDVYPLKRIEFADTTFWAPNNPDGILTTMFGDYMTLPPVEEREAHAISLIVNYKK